MPFFSTLPKNRKSQPSCAWGHLVKKQLSITAVVGRLSGRTIGQSALNLVFRHEELDFAVGNVQLDFVAGLDRGQRSAHGSLGRDVQYVSSEAGTAHAGVADAHDVVDAALEQLDRYGQMPPLRETGAALRAGVLQNENRVFVDLEIFVVDVGAQVAVALEDHCPAAVSQQVGRRRGLLDHRTVRSQVAVENRRSALAVSRLVQGPDHVRIGAFGVAYGSRRPICR